MTLEYHQGFEQPDAENILLIPFMSMQNDIRGSRISASFILKMFRSRDIRISSLHFYMVKDVDCLIVRANIFTHTSHIVKWMVFTPAIRQSSVTDSPGGGADCRVALSKFSKVAFSNAKEGTSSRTEHMGLHRHVESMIPRVHLHFFRPCRPYGSYFRDFRALPPY